MPKKRNLKQDIATAILCTASALILVLSFSRVELSGLAWIALVPFLYVLDGQSIGGGARRSYLWGLLFFGLLFSWFVHVTLAGAVLLVAFLALYSAFFGMIFVFFKPLNTLLRIVARTCAWVGLEFIRAHFLTGFGWGMLGHTQYQNLALIQIADHAGVYGVSFVLVMVNLVIFEIVSARKFLLKPIALAVAMLAVVLVYGFRILGQQTHYSTVRVGVVQPNIPLAMDWNQTQRPWIVARTLRLTQVLAHLPLDVIVWPETSLPGVMDTESLLMSAIKSDVVKRQTPLLIGSVAHVGTGYTNAAFLIDSDGSVKQRYDKIHLVPFGEYLPLRSLWGGWSRFISIDDFTEGKRYTIFETGTSAKKFAVLICFEDTVEYLWRDFSNKGAGFFINMTNDAWFKETQAPFLHLQAAVLNAVANHRSLARAANTGVSALIDPWGRFVAQVQDVKGKKIFTQGVVWGILPMNPEKTFYTRHGDVFIYLCFLAVLGAFLLRLKKQEI